MKKVWILEGFISKSRMEKNINDMADLFRKAETLEQADSILEASNVYKMEIAKHPDGYWLAYQGKTNYKQFCECAHETLRNMQKENMQWRVIEAEIEDEANTWTDYKPIKENLGVMKYLWATI